ncbi:MAG: alpha-glucan family phosphorylase [Bacillota bacterium]
MLKTNVSASSPRIAYFCMEYGLHVELPVYAGGMGVLAGDYLKTAHDMGIPMVGIGILWRQDYTTQLIGEDGNPYDVYPTYDYNFLKDTGATIQVTVRGEDVTCKIFMVDRYGNAPLYLLDCGTPGSKHGWITSRLYGGTDEDRVAQEIVLGIGGVKVLRSLGIKVDVYHFNEGHALYAGIELIREKMSVEKMTFEEAWKATREEVIFTTHTPVLAGNESHDHSLLQRMGAYNGLAHDQIKQLGGDPFNMTVAALRICRLSNAVSQLHGNTARRMWANVTGAASIIHITNGVHLGTWQDPRIREAYEKGRDLWTPHCQAKKELIEFVKQKTGSELREDALLVGFARRAAPYKRSELIFRNANVIEPLLKERKIQLLFSGKAHPNDTQGKEIIKDLVRMDRRYGESVVFLENYDMEIANMLVRGCDIWLNNPKRPMEASGTSGMKAAVNGVLNVSVVDGWVAEGVRHNVSGWLLDEMAEGVIEEWNQDEKDLNALYRVLFEEVIPSYYENRAKWEKMMRASIEMGLRQFSSERMLREYNEKMYSMKDGAMQLSLHEYASAGQEHVAPLNPHQA